MANGYNNPFDFSGQENLMMGSNRTQASPFGLPTNTTQNTGFDMNNLFSGFGMKDALGLGGLYLGSQQLSQSKDAFDFEKGLKNKQLAMLEEDRLENKERRTDLRNIRF